MDLAWLQANRRQLLMELAQIKQQLVQQIQVPIESIERFINVTADPITQLDELPSALVSLCVQFSLSNFERKLLLLCLGMELDSDFAELCVQALPGIQLPYPTPILAMSIFPDGNWQSFDSQSPLIYWQFLELGDGTNLSTKRLQLNERTWRYLLGLTGLENRLVTLLKPLGLTQLGAQVTTKTLQQLLQLWSDERQNIPCINLYGNNIEVQEQLVSDFCRQASLIPYRLPLAALTGNVQEVEYLKRLLIKEARLSNCFYLIDCYVMDSQTKTRLAAVMDEFRGYCLLMSNGPLTDFTSSLINLPVPPLSPTEQIELWQQVLTETNNPGQIILSKLTMQFNLSPRQIKTIADAVNKQAVVDVNTQAGCLWDFCRSQSRGQLDARIKLIEPKADWDSLILPETQKQSLQSIASQIQQRYRVYQEWGFADKKNNKGLGICVLFAGLSGTGKTLAAEVLAKELDLDLYQVDLSAVVSKYIGETEKNLATVFSAAERSGAVLLFDEADALFGKRSEVKDSRDRYANMEVSYLLQRIEAYQGLSILTTNLKNAMDEAFLRRFRFVIDFEFPTVDERKQIWKQIFPSKAQINGLDFEQLASLNISGGNIANIAMNAAFNAAQQEQPIDMTHLKRAINDEYLKLQQILTEWELPQR